MSRKGMNGIAFFYFFTALVCFMPFYHYRYFILLVPGLIYALPFIVIAWGLIRQRAWGRKLAILASVIVILTVSPLLLRKKLTIVFPFPYLMSVTYPSDAAVPFKTILGTLSGGHLFCLAYLFRRSVREQFS
jgi:uncharacterized membrane protein (UPF0136 family)